MLKGSMSTSLIALGIYVIQLGKYRYNFSAIYLIELENICRNMKENKEYRRISTVILLDNWNTVGNILLRIINRSLKTGIFPDDWRESMVTPVEKIGNTIKCEEYRPKNTLRTCEKIFENIVKDQLEEYSEKHSLLSKYQSGFRKKYSCETGINHVINRWKFIGNNRKVLAIFLDFKRVFETIDRDVFLKKLSCYGIKDKELRWISSYLTRRRQITKVNDVESSMRENDFGVPQGSILGALLFIIYINDIENVMEKWIVLYADDTLIYTDCTTCEKLYVRIGKDMDK